uniref:Uncharacterized protein n=1 Tax=Trypanosoma congolense (strain IL3000) TaxID=1068625 RepID=G0USZ2_TRYCI|nr:hypothetical protein, unlikely [Trypanosoma congolense IL3000]
MHSRVHPRTKQLSLVITAGGASARFVIKASNTPHPPLRWAKICDSARWGAAFVLKSSQVYLLIEIATSKHVARQGGGVCFSPTYTRTVFQNLIRKRKVDNDCK